MESGLDWHTARALLEWQVELGATEAMGETPVDRFALPEKMPRPAGADAVPPTPAAARATAPAPVGSAASTAAKGAAAAEAAAEALAASAGDLDALRHAMESFEHCDLRQGARNFVFSDGTPGAPLMILGEAPGRDEDRDGRPFVGRAGQLLDRMLAAIDMGRDRDGAGAVYITNVLPWRPPQNRTPTPAEIAMFLPFLRRHVDLAAPKLLVVMGNTPLQAVLGRSGILRARGHWAEGFDRPVMPMTHPAYLLRTPEAKREAWADLLEIRAKLTAAAP